MEIRDAPQFNLEYYIMVVSHLATIILFLRMCVKQI
jgi:hypothetical protein